MIERMGDDKMDGNKTNERMLIFGGSEMEETGGVGL